MNFKRIFFLVLIIIVSFGFFVVKNNQDNDNQYFVSYIVNPKKQNLSFFWKDDNQLSLKSIQNLKTWLKIQNKELLFAMNGGMYKKDNSPQGLFIQDNVEKSVIDTTSGNGNFYLKPNGVFYITTDNKSGICETTKFVNSKIKYATQSGPMLVVDGEIHSAFKEKSTNLNIRNGVGILPNNQLIFVMSKKEVNFYDFANYFKKQGCKNALYLDGFVSRTYLPEKNWIQTDGNFGVIIGVTKNK